MCLEHHLLLTTEDAGCALIFKPTRPGPFLVSTYVVQTPKSSKSGSHKRLETFPLASTHTHTHAHICKQVQQLHAIIKNSS